MQDEIDSPNEAKFDKNELGEIEKIRDMLEPSEIIKAIATQSKTAPGGRLIAQKTIIATNKRVLIRDPSMMGLRSQTNSIPYSQINNVKLEKGVFSSKVKITSGYFNKDDEGFIDAIPKDKAETIVAILNEGIKSAQYSSAQVVQPKTEDDPLTLLKKRLARGEISKEEFEELRKLIE